MKKIPWRGLIKTMIKIERIIIETWQWKFWKDEPYSYRQEYIVPSQEIREIRKYMKIFFHEKWIFLEVQSYSINLELYDKHDQHEIVMK